MSLTVVHRNLPVLLDGSTPDPQEQNHRDHISHGAEGCDVLDELVDLGSYTVIPQQVSSVALPSPVQS